MQEPRSVEERLRWQATACEQMGSPLYAALLERAADDYVSGGATRDVLAGHSESPPGSALALRFLGAIHRVALAGEAPEIANFYPSCGGTVDADAAWGAIQNLLPRRSGDVAGLVARPVQTNEVRRSAALVGGFLMVGDETRLPLRLLEIGASAGLNLRWDHYRYEASGWEWGPASSPVRLASFVVPPPFDLEVEVVERAGCDSRPLDPATDEGRLTLMSYVWADQVERLELLDAALDVAGQVPARVERGNAVEWAHGQLNTSTPGTATVVFHSIVWQYLSADEQRDFAAVMSEAGASATAEAPVAWLSFEPAEQGFDVRLRLWPQDIDRVVARSSAHGQEVRWDGGAHWGEVRV